MSGDVVDRILAQEFDMDPVADDAHFRADLGLDSLDAVEFVMALEECLATDIPDEVAEAWSTAGDVRAWLALQDDSE